MNVLPDARHSLRILITPRTIFRTVNRKYFARKKRQPQVTTDVSRKSSTKGFLIYAITNLFRRSKVDYSAKTFVHMIFFLCFAFFFARKNSAST